MITLKKIIRLLAVVLLSAVCILYVRGYLKRRMEDSFHASISKTIRLTSPAFSEGAMIPPEYSADGGSHSPELSWENIPTGTKSIVLLMTDYDAPAPWLPFTTVTHWALYNISSGIQTIARDETSEHMKKNGITAGPNYKGEYSYAGPKPPIGVHIYHIHLYALDVPSFTWSSGERKDLFAQMKNHVLAYGELSGRY